MVIVYLFVVALHVRVFAVFVVVVSGVFGVVYLFNKKASLQTEFLAQRPLSIVRYRVSIGL